MAQTKVHAAAGINQQLNFQGRLLNSSGATVPDGVYNIAFKIYQDGDGQSVGDTTGSPAGTLKWTENHLVSSSTGVTIKNGYLSVQLGSVNAFGSSIDWNQDTLWLSVDIGNTASCTITTSFDADCGGDGEMTPMKRLSSNPYALNSGLLGGLASSQFVQLAQGLQTDTGNSVNSIYINKTGTGGNFIDLQAGGVDAFTLTNSGNVSFGNNTDHTISVTTAAAGIAGKSLTISAGTAGSGGSALAGGTLTLQGGSGGGTNGNGGDVTIDAGAPSGTGSGGSINIGTANATTINIATNNTAHTIAIGSGTAVQGITIGSTNGASSLTFQAGSGGISLNGSTSISGANTFSTGTGTVTIQGATTVSANLTVTNAANVAFQKGTDFSTTGPSNNVSFGTGVLIRLTGASAQTITGIAGGVDGRILTIVNAASQAATISYLSGSSSGANQINTGTGSDLSLAPGAAIYLAYDSGSSLWRVVGSSSSTVGFIQLQGSTPGSQQSGNFNISGSGLLASLDATIANGSLSIGTSRANTIQLGNTTAATTVNIEAGTGASAIQIGNGATAHDIKIGTGAAAQTVTLGSTNTTSTTTLQAGSGGIVLGAATTVQANLTVTNAGSFATQRGTDVSATTLNDANLGASSLVRLTGTSTQTLTGITAGVDGRILTIVNAGTQAAVISNQSASSTTASDRILTGTAGDISLPTDASLTLIYDSGTSRWRVIGSSAATGGYIQLQGSSPGSQQNGNFNISGTGLASGVDATTSNGTLSLGTSRANTVQVGNTTAATTLSLQGGTGASAIAIQTGASGTINIGTTAQNQTIQIGTTATNTGNTQTIAIGNTNVAGTTNVTIGTGSSATGGSTTLQAKGTLTLTGTGGITASGAAASSLTTSSGALTLTSAAAATWSTSAGLLTIQGTGGVTVQSASGTTSSAVTVQSGNASAGASGNVSIDNGTFTSGTPSISLGTSNARSISIGNANSATTYTEESGTGTTNLFNGNTAHVIQLATGGTSTTQSVTIGSATNTTSTLTLQAGNGGSAITLQTGNNGTAAGGIQIGNTTGAFTQAIGIGNNTTAGSSTSVTVGSTIGSSPLVLQAGTGGASLDAGTGSINIGTSANNKSINIGATVLTANTTTVNIANTIGNATQTVNIGSSSSAANAVLIQGGTGSSAISLQSGAGGSINVGTSNSANTVQIGSGSLSAGTQTIYIGTGASGNGAGTTNVTIGSASGATAGLTTVQAKGNIVFSTNGTTRGTFDTSNNFYFGNGVSAAAPNNFTIQGTASTTTAVAGGSITIQGGNATVGSANGGNITLSGGTGVGTGVNGLVILTTPTFQTASTQSCGSNCTITQSNVDGSSTIVVNATTSGLIVSLPSPTISSTYGRVVYVTAATGSNDFTLRVNGGGAGNDIAMRSNTTATMVWGPGSGSGAWTAAGASSSTTLQAAYDNTLTSAGGAELVLSKTSNHDGLTIRDSSSSAINGTLLEVQTANASTLFSVNGTVTDYATNGGAETQGASSSTFPASTWSTFGSGVTLARNTTSTTIATGQASVSVGTTAATSGTKDALASALTANLNYNVSFTALLGSGTFNTMNVYYSVDGTTQSVACVTGQAIATSIWTKVNCVFTAPSSGITSNNAILIFQTDGTARTFYIDNLSVTISASQNYATDGGVDDAVNFTTNWTAAGTTSISRNTSDGNDTSDSAQVSAGTTINNGVRNKLSINPLTSTLYRVSVYTKLNSGPAFTDFKVRYSRDGGTNFVDCVDYNTQTVVTTGWTQVTCYINTDSTAPSGSGPYIYFVQPTAPGSARTFSVDTFSMTISSNAVPYVQIGGGTFGGPTTLLTLDKSASAPIAANNASLLGSMYYDTTLGKLQCYEADGWGACGSSPDNIITISPEYTNAVLHGTGVGTMTSDICSDALNINDGSSGQATICGTNETYNFYKWTSPQASAQTYSIYVTYQLPSTFKSFSSGSTSLMGRTDSSNATVEYSVYRNNSGSGLSQCGSTIAVSTGSVSSWQTGVASGAADPSTCSFGAGDSIVFKIDVIASSNANAYVGNLGFTFSNK